MVTVMLIVYGHFLRYEFWTHEDGMNAFRLFALAYWSYDDVYVSMEDEHGHLIYQWERRGGEVFRPLPRAFDN